MSEPTLAVGPALDISKLDTAQPLTEIFQPYQTTLERWQSQIEALTVTNIHQTAAMEQARIARLELKQARVAMDKRRKELVEGLKERTSKIDGVARQIRVAIEDLEEKLRASEEFKERYLAQQKAELKQGRELELQPFMEGPIAIDLSELSEEDYARVLDNAKLAQKIRAEQAAKAEAERKAKEEAERLERERIKAENERLKAEAQKRERAAAEERKRVEAETKQREAEHAAQLEKVRKQGEELAEKLRKENAAAQQTAPKPTPAPTGSTDKEKLLAFADSVRALTIPDLADEIIRLKMSQQTSRFADWVEKCANDI